MMIKNKPSPEKKLETQQRIIEQFEKEKAQLLDAIETLTFEKEFDKENNMESIKLAKSLFESMEKQMAASRRTEAPSTTKRPVTSVRCFAPSTFIILSTAWR